MMHKAWLAPSAYKKRQWHTLNEKVGFIDQKGKVVIPLKYNQANSFSGGLARVVESYGTPVQFVDKRGAVHVQLKPDAEDWLAFLMACLC